MGGRLQGLAGNLLPRVRRVLAVHWDRLSGRASNYNYVHCLLSLRCSCQTSPRKRTRVRTFLDFRPDFSSDAASSDSPPNPPRNHSANPPQDSSAELAHQSHTSNSADSIPAFLAYSLSTAVKMPRKKRGVQAMLEDTDSGDFEKILDTTAQIASELATFRPGSKSTHNNDDRVLMEYRQFTMLQRQLQGDSDDEIDSFCFPPSVNEDFEELFDQINRFLIWIAQTAKPRAMSDDRIGYRHLQKYCQGLQYYIPEIYRRRHEIAPGIDIVKSSLQKVVVFLMKKFDLKSEQVSEKPFLGPAELEQLLDYDMQHTISIELAEGHHLAWTLARACGLRPSSLGPLNKQIAADNVAQPYLTFGDIKITRDDNNGRFTMELTVRNVKGNGLGDAEDATLLDKTLFFKLKSPLKVHNLAISPVYRFLALCLRRKALLHYTTVDELFAGAEHYITLKPEFSSQPVMLAGKDKGSGVIQGESLTAANLTKYLACRGEKLGYETRLSFYAFRRRTATDFARTLGRDKARELLGHAPNSDTLEKYYLNETPFYDLGAIAGNEPHTIRQADLELEASELALARLPTETVQRILCKEAPQAVKEARAANEDAPPLGTSAHRNEARNSRYSIVKDLIKAAHEQQRETITISEVERRKQQILEHDTAFNHKVLEMSATDLRPTRSSSMTTLRRSAVEAIDEVLVVPDENDYLSQAAESAFLKAVNSIPYLEAAKNVTTILLENLLSQQLIVEEGTCVLCEIDPARSETEQKRLRTKAKLKQHMQNTHGKGKLSDAELAAQVNAARFQLAGSTIEERYDDLSDDEMHAAELPQTGMPHIRMPRSGLLGRGSLTDSMYTSPAKIIVGSNPKNVAAGLSEPVSSTSTSSRPALRPVEKLSTRNKSVAAQVTGNGPPRALVNAAFPPRKVLPEKRQHTGHSSSHPVVIDSDEE